MVANHLKLCLVSSVLLLGPSLNEAEPKPLNDALPKGARVRFGVSRPILRTNPGVGLVSPKFTEFLAPTTTGGVRRYDVGTGRALEKRGLTGPGLVVVSENGKRAAVCRPGAVNVVDVATGEVVMAAQPPQGLAIVGLTRVSLSADGNVLAYGARGNDGKGWIVVCDVEKKSVRTHFETMHAAPVTPTLAPDGSKLISHGPPFAPKAPAKQIRPLPVVNLESDRSAQIWDAASGEELHKFQLIGAGGPIVASAFSPAGRLVAMSAGDGPICLWDVKSGKRLHIFLGRVGQGVRIAFSPDGKTIASVGADFRIQRWTTNGKSLEITNAPEGMYSAPISGLQFADNERVIAWMTINQFVFAWEAPSGKVLSPETGHGAPIKSVSFGDGGKDFFTSGRDGRVLRWDLEKGKILETIALHPARIPTKPPPSPVVNLSADLTHASWLHTPIEIFDFASGNDLFSVPHPSTIEGVVAYAYSTTKDATKVMTVSRKSQNERTCSCVVWDLATRQRIAEFDYPGAPPGAPMAVQFSPSQKRLFASHIILKRGGVQVVVSAAFELKTGKQVGEEMEVVVPLGGAISLTSVDETSIVIASSLGRLIHADYVSDKGGTQIDALPARADGTSCIGGFSPDRKHFAIGVPTIDPDTYAVRLYDWTTKKLRGTFEGHLGPICLVEFSPDNKTFITGSEDSSVLHWDLDKLPPAKR